jgi:hypothetical protein
MDFKTHYHTDFYVSMEGKVSSFGFSSQDHGGSEHRWMKPKNRKTLL